MQMIWAVMQVAASFGGEGGVWSQMYLPLELSDCSPEESVPHFVRIIFHRLVHSSKRKAKLGLVPSCNSPSGIPSISYQNTPCPQR